jgi:hypothetical protein
MSRRKIRRLRPHAHTYALETRRHGFSRLQRRYIYPRCVGTDPIDHARISCHSAVDPHKSSGQNLWRQYTGKKGKLVLSSHWIHECVKAGQLQTFHTNWAGCKVTGTESYVLLAIPFLLSLPSIRVTPVQDVQPSTSNEPPSRRRGRHHDTSTIDQSAHQIQPQPVHHQSISPMAVDPVVPAHNTFPYPVYTTNLHPQPPRGLPPAPPQTWQASTGIVPQQTHLAAVGHMISRPPFREDGWDGYDPTAAQAAADGMAGPATNGYDYRYRDDQNGWVGSNPYYDPSVSLGLCGRVKCC